MRGKGLIIGGILLIAGIAVGGGGGYMLGKSKAAPAAKPAGQQAATPSPPEEKNLYNGDELTLPEMLANLQSSSGDEFDRRMVIYILSIRNIETGMLRLAETKAYHAQLKDFAKIQREQNEKVIPMIYKWQSDWGYTDH